MNASKEQAELALKNLGVIDSWCASQHIERPEDLRTAFQTVGEFLNRAKRKLPSEAAYERARK